MFSKEPMKLKGQRPEGLGDQKDRSTACRGDTKNELLNSNKDQGVLVLKHRKDTNTTQERY